MHSDALGTIVLMAYYLIIVALLPIMFKYYFKIPTEYARKAHHIGYSLSIFILLRMFSTWYAAVGGAFLLVLIGYPVLLLVEKLPIYRKAFVDRTKGAGELRRQLIYVQLSFALLIFIFWGLLGTSWHYIAAVAVMAWGFGDAAAALVGKAIGRRHIINRYIERAKTIEGTLAMTVTAALALFLTLVFYGGIHWLSSLLIAVIVAPACSLVELFSRRGLDTITVPLTASALILPLAYIFRLLGW